MIGIQELLISFGLLLIAMTVHEFSHGLVAYTLGDPTAKNSGRLTLNPLAHIDPVGTILLPLALFFITRGRYVFGAAKPVPVNYWALKNPKRDMVLIGSSGPLANYLFALLITMLVKIIAFPPFINLLLINLIIINVVLGTFNLLPLPPLDGSRILMGLLPDSLAARYAKIEPYGIFIVALLIWGPLGNFIWYAVEVILRLLAVSY